MQHDYSVWLLACTLDAPDRHCTPILNKIPRMTALCQGIMTTDQCMLAYYHPNVDGLFPMGQGAYDCRLVVVTFAGPSENRQHKSGCISLELTSAFWSVISPSRLYNLSHLLCYFLFMLSFNMAVLYYTLAAIVGLVLAARIVFSQSSDKETFPNGPPSLPFLGHLHQIPLQKSFITFAEWSRTYGASSDGLIGLRMGPSARAVVLSKWQHVRDRKFGPLPELRTISTKARASKVSWTSAC